MPISGDMLGHIESIKFAKISFFKDKIFDQ